MDTQPRRAFGDALREYRERAKMSREELGALARYNSKIIGEMEEGGYLKQPRMASIQRLGAALGLSLREIAELLAHAGHSVSLGVHDLAPLWYMEKALSSPHFSRRELKDATRSEESTAEESRRTALESYLALVLQVAERFRPFLGPSIGDGSLLLEDLVGAGNVELVRFMADSSRWDDASASIALRLQGGLGSLILQEVGVAGYAVKLPLHKIAPFIVALRTAMHADTGIGLDPRMTAAMEVEIVPATVAPPVRLGSAAGDARLATIPSQDPAVEEEAVRAVAVEEAWGAIERLLTAKEARVILRRFGFVGEPATLEELAGEMGFKTREQIRTIETMALRKLRRHWTPEGPR